MDKIISVQCNDHDDIKKKITSGRTTFPTSLHGRTAYGASLASTEVYLAKYYSLKAISNL